MFCSVLRGVLVVGAGSGGWRGGLWRSGLWDESLGLPHAIHEQFQMAPTNLLQGTTEPLSQNTGILGPFFITVCFIGNQ